jgi:hypothetical protein
MRYCPRCQKTVAGILCACIVVETAASGAQFYATQHDMPHLDPDHHAPDNTSFRSLIVATSTSIAASTISSSPIWWRIPPSTDRKV